MPSYSMDRENLCLWAAIRDGIPAERCVMSIRGEPCMPQSLQTPKLTLPLEAYISKMYNWIVMELIFAAVFSSTG